MKLVFFKKVFFTAIFCCASIIGMSQVCTSKIIKYSGPQSTEELENILSSSFNPTLQNLSSQTKESILQFSVFEDGRLKGFSGTDENIEELFENNIFTSVMSTILKMEVVLVEDRTIPIPTISLDAFLEMTGGIFPGLAIGSGASWCKNCYADSSTACCQVGGSGCCDYNVFINGSLFNVEL